MDDALTIILALISGLIGSLIGAIASSYTSYKFNIKLSKKQLVLKEKIKEYESIEDKINQLHEIYTRFVDKKEYSEIKNILNVMETVIKHFMMFNTPRELYVSQKIRNLISEYSEFIKENNLKQNLTNKEILSLAKKIDDYTIRIENEIEKELGVRR